MQIEFYKNGTHEFVNNDNLFVMGNIVYEALQHTYESKFSVIGFYDFIKERSDLYWDAV